MTVVKLISICVCDDATLLVTQMNLNFCVDSCLTKMFWGGLTMLDEMRDHCEKRDSTFRKLELTPRTIRKCLHAQLLRGERKKKRIPDRLTLND